MHQLLLQTAAAAGPALAAEGSVTFSGGVDMSFQDYFGASPEAFDSPPKVTLRREGEGGEDNSVRYLTSPTPKVALQPL